MIVTPFDSIDWADPAIQISKHVCVQEAIGLPSWQNRLATPADGMTAAVQQALFDFLTGPFDELLDGLGLRAHVDCCYRPISYNAKVGGAPQSAHMCLGPWAAIDWKPLDPMSSQVLSCDDVRQRILDAGWLDKLNLRMERKDGSSWVHNDSRPPGPAGRYFVP